MEQVGVARGAVYEALTELKAISNLKRRFKYETTQRK